MKPVCLIVGAGPGIGQAVALAFAREGHDVALAARQPDKLREFLPAIEKAGADVRTYAADAGDEGSLRALFGTVRRELGDPDVVIYNPAAHQVGKPTTLKSEELVADFRVNVLGALVCAQEAAPAMMTRGRGTILLTGGGFAHEPAANYASLSLGKAALRSLTYTLAQELGVDGIHVATVTVHGFVQPGTKFDPRNIAASYIALYRQPQGHFEIEKIFK
jgi:NAD(P)-dependent dehydrogenase (short-subunit alcohol dehydrogenase family)